MANRRLAVSWCAIALAAVLSAPAVLAVAPAPSTTVLYDYNLATDSGYTPTTPGWLSGGLFFSTESVGSDGTTVNSGLGAYAGYANRESTLTIVSIFPLVFQVGTGNHVNSAFPVLDRNEGFKLTIGFRMLDEDHSGNSNRAGFSITLLDAEHKGVEIGFQSDRIFAQHDGTTGPMFTAAENTTSAAHIGALGSFNTWELQVNAGGYALTRGGAAVLAGALRDYSAYTGLGQAAYDSTSFLFVGDNTSSAGSIFTLQYLAITTAPVPEPSAYALLLAGLALVGAGARRRRLP